MITNKAIEEQEKVLMEQKVGILTLEWFVQSQNLCWGGTSSSDHSEEQPELQEAQLFF